MRRKSRFRVMTIATAMSMVLSANTLGAGWTQDENKWQYFQTNGVKTVSSWLKTEDQKWYYLDDQGNMKTGWHLDADGRWYYLNADGSMATGWVLVNEKWYYLSLTSGELLVNTVTPDGYRVDANGAWTGGVEKKTSSGSSRSGGSGGGSSTGDGNQTGEEEDDTDDKDKDKDDEDDGGEDNSENDNKKEVPDFVGFIDAVAGATTPAIVDTIELEAGDAASIELGYSGNMDYHSSLSDITVTKDGITIRTYTAADWGSEYILTLNDFSAAGQYEVRLAAEGYRNKQLSATVRAGSTEGVSGTIFNTAKCSVFNIEQVQYAVVTFANGNLDAYQIYLNGQPVQPKPVNDQKTIVKMEVNPYEAIEVKAVSRSDSSNTHQISMGSGTKPFTGLIQDEHPQYVLASGPISVFDYYLSNYDEDGNVRVHPAKSTFDTVAEGQTTPDGSLPVLYAATTRLGEDIAITFDRSEETKAWQKGIYAVQKDYGTGSGSRQPLSYSVVDGKIVIDADSTPIAGRNEKHTIIIKSEGYSDAKIVVELVIPAGEIQLSGNFNWWAGQDLLFELTDFNYAIVNPIYAVYLDDMLLTGDCYHYHIVSYLVRLENESHKLLTPGLHTLVIKAEGYEDYQKVFYLEKPLAGQENPTMGSADSVDAAYSSFDALKVQTAEAETEVVADILPLDGMSRATGGSSGGTGGEGGGVNIRGNIIFDFDLIANARILAALDLGTDHSAEVLSWWYSLTKDAVITQDGQQKLIDYTYFKNYCGMPFGDDDYMTFYELYVTVPPAPENIFTEEAHPALYLGGANQVKDMLEDGLLGDLYDFWNAVAKTSPAVSVKAAAQNQDLVLEYADMEDAENWADGIKQITMNGYRPVTGFEVDKTKRTVTIPANENNIFNYGENSVVIYSESYQNVSLTAFIGSENLSELKAELDGDGNVIITGLTETYAAEISGVSLNGTGLFSDSQVGDGNGSYELKGTSLILRAKLFTDAMDQQYVLLLKAYGYSDVLFRFTPSELELNGDIRIPVPGYVVLDQGNTYEAGENVTVITGEYLSADSYQKDITAVTVNGKEVENQDTGWFSYKFMIAGSEFTEAGDYTIIIYAAGYEDQQFDITITKTEGKAVPNYIGIDNSAHSTGVIDSKDIEPGEKVTIALGDMWNADYYNKLTEVVIRQDDEETAVYQKSDLTMTGMLSYSFVLDEFFKAGSVYTVTLFAEGYEEKELTVKVAGIPVVTEGKEVPSYVALSNQNSYEVNEDVTLTVSNSYFGCDYQKAITAVMVNGSEVDNQSTGWIVSEYVIAGSEFTEAGDYTIVIQADGYQDREFKITIISAEGKAVPDAVGIAAGEYGGSAVSSIQIKEGAAVRIILGDWFDTTYSSRFTDVTVILDGDEISYYEKSDLSLGYIYSDFTLYDFDEAGEYTIILCAEGYEEAEFTVVVTAVRMKDAELVLPEAEVKAEDEVAAEDEDVTEEGREESDENADPQTSHDSETQKEDEDGNKTDETDVQNEDATDETAAGDDKNDETETEAEEVEAEAEDAYPETEIETEAETESEPDPDEELADSNAQISEDIEL